MAASVFLEVFAATVGAKIAGAGKKALLGAMSGVLFGLPFGVPGLIIGPLVGAGIGEYLDVRSWPQAAKAAAGTLLGLVLAVAFKLATACLMLLIFVIAWVF